ncbi:FGGY family carbohydrate kinase [Salinisphaera hydrothermalis]|uniref:ATP:glycerol 3-phosphotransferase n=1 Tax=Salinisphaera hydrothermalis (strain C41B8) TaxID=1304275 RepID=A0A084IID7_SALHC|nr:FGGY family carbohydrate kinase [Salinisphaera hydrothermalis]KEZ76471.1 glycerol kinase [Salinisphaera hydrothermalis C41B8]
MTRVLAIDQGTSGTKAVVVDDDGRICGLAEQPVTPDYRAEGIVEQDPQALLDSVLAAGRAALAEAGVDVDIVTLANQGETVLAWDPDTGAPLSKMIVWQDRRAEDICRELAAHAERLADKTGLVLDPYFSAPKMAWLRRHVTREGVVTTSDSWLIHQLTGAFVTDVTTASRSAICGLDDLAWDRELLDRFGLADERLPEIVACDEIVGLTHAFGGSVPVGGLVVDQQAALVGENCLVPGEAKCTFGTGAFVLANIGETPTRSTRGLTTSAAWRVRDRNQYCVDGQVYTAASAVRWLAELGWIDTAADLDQAAAETSQGAFCVPAFAGLAAPWWRPEARARFTGMSLATKPGHLVLAVLEGIAAQVAELTDLIGTDAGQPLERLRVDGGLTQSQRLMQAVADLTQIPLDVYPHAHATPMGAAALARMALDPHDETRLVDTVIDWQPSAVYEPGWSADRAAAFRDDWRAQIG